MKSHVTSGAKTKLFVNGKPYGRATAFRWNSSTPKHAIYGIDSSEPFELASTITKLTGSISVVKLAGDGGAEGAGMAAPYPELSREKYFSLTLVEIDTDLVVFRAARCSLTSQSWDVPSRGLVTGTFDFEAIEWDSSVTQSSS